MALIFVPGIITYKKILYFCVSVHLFRSQMTGGAKLVENEKGGTCQRQLRVSLMFLPHFEVF